ncbi:MAG: TolC family outer membrane protein [Methanobacterium sp.]|nr:TolC family outer membrane protein [Methanobacterium sp.]
MVCLRSCLPATAVLLFVAGAAHAQSLEEVLVTTYSSNPQIEADRARQRAADDDVARALGGWRPVATLQMQHGRGHDIYQYKQTKQNISPYYPPNPSYSVHEWRTPDNLLLQIQQSIFDGGRTSADLRHAQLAVEIGLSMMVSVEQQVLGNAVQSYYDLYRDQQIVELARQNVAWLEEQAAAVHARYQVKDVTQTDVAQAEARLARGISDLTSAEGTLEVTRSAFQAATGIVPGVLPPPPSAPVALLPASRDEALALAETSPDLRAAQLNALVAESDVDYLASGLMPNLSLQATARRMTNSDQAYLGTTDQQVLLSLTIPLYEAGVSAARVRGAKQTVGQRRLEVDSARRKAVDQVTRSWQQLQSARSSIRSLTEQVRAADVARTSIRAEMRVGTRTVLDQLNTEQELMDAKISLLRAQHDEVVSTYGVLVSVGHLTASSLGLPVELYDPSVHYEKVRNQWAGTGIDENYDKKGEPQ